MRSLRFLLLVPLLACAAAPASRADEACAGCRYDGSLMAVFVAPQVIGSDWELVHEEPGYVTGDPDMRRAGVRATQALHYTQPVPGGSRTCSVELWRFTGPEAARRAAVGNSREGWRIRVLGNLWVMVHGVSMQRGEPFKNGLLPECHQLADLTEGRALALLTRKLR
jgi:hypothetical protein